VVRHQCYNAWVPAWWSRRASIVAGVLLVGLVGLAHHGSGHVRCPTAPLRSRLDDWEARARTNAGLFAVEGEIAAVLSTCTESPYLSQMLWNEPSIVEGHDLHRPICAGREPVPSSERRTDETWQSQRGLGYERCGFERYGLLDDRELRRVEPPPLSFWLGVDELFDSGLDRETARRVARLLLLAYDANRRAPQRFVLGRAELRYTPRSGPGRSWSLDEHGDLTTHDETLFELGRAAVTLSIGPDARGRDLGWLFDYCDDSSNCFELYFASPMRTDEGLPVIAELRHTPYTEAPPTVFTVVMQPDGVRLGLDATQVGRPIPWDQYETQLGLGLPPTGRVDVMIDVDLDAEVFLPALVELDQVMGPRAPWLVPMDVQQ
jgi:hypothetical protein